MNKSPEISGLFLLHFGMGSVRLLALGVWTAIAGVFEADSSVFVVLDGAFDGGGLALGVLVVEVFEIGDAPAAPGAGSETF
jgi:hypothetical protein